MNRSVRVITTERVFVQNLTSNDEFFKFCKNLSVYISSSYLKRTVQRIIRQNFFYFLPNEQTIILNYVISDFDNSITDNYIYTKLVSWFINSDELNLDGFVNFRLKQYSQYIELLVQEAVDKYIVFAEKERLINYFKETLRQQIPYIDTVYVYSENGCYDILNESRKNIITVKDCDELFLNVMISLAPSKIYFHGICNNINFFDTFKSVFENRIKLVN